MALDHNLTAHGFLLNPYFLFIVLEIPSSLLQSNIWNEHLPHKKQPETSSGSNFHSPSSIDKFIGNKAVPENKPSKQTAVKTSIIRQSSFRGTLVGQQ